MFQFSELLEVRYKVCSLYKETFSSLSHQTSSNQDFWIRSEKIAHALKQTLLSLSLHTPTPPFKSKSFCCNSCETRQRVTHLFLAAQLIQLSSFHSLTSVPFFFFLKCTSAQFWIKEEPGSFKAMYLFTLWCKISWNAACHHWWTVALERGN